MTFAGSGTALGLLLASLLLSSCALTKGADEQVILRLAPPPVQARQSAWQGDVKLPPARARGLVSQLRYAYAPGDGGALQQARTLIWDRPPPEYLAQALDAALRGAGLRVLKAGEAGKSVILIAPTLLQFEERSGPATHAAVAFDLEIQPEGRATIARRYCGRAPIRSADASARAAAFGVALDSAVQAFLQDSPDKATSTGDCATSLPSSRR